ncbi:hypothetical protein LY76DRAFT_598384 [Colletotrichum caudatum]|nr:hypothetical protein LY76DRAFT_598384 [Colletotrichum caudatum]
MVASVLLTGRNNSTTAWMRLKYDDRTMLHRWIGIYLSRASHTDGALGSQEQSQRG